MDRALASLASRPAQTATDQVFDTLYKAVISLDLPPGTKVSEADIAKQLDVSRQPVRDAFYRLSKLGFLSVRPQRATLVTKISEAAVTNAIFVRTALEVECLRQAALDARETLVEALRLNLALQKEAMELSDPAEFHALDEAFHQIICQTAGHIHAWTLIREQKAHMDRIRYLTLSQERRKLVYQQHLDVVDCLAANDLAGAEASFRSHVGDIANVMERVRRENISYFEESS